MRIDIMTLFPEYVDAILSESIIGRARRAGKLDIRTHNIRDYSEDKHRRVDDTPYGGGRGMLMAAPPIWRCYNAVAESINADKPEEERTKPYLIYMSPRGRTFNQTIAKELAEKNGGKPIPSLVFQHIPVPEEYELLREAKPYERLDSVQGHKTYSDKYYVLKPQVEGYLGEAPAVPDFNGGEFAAWKETGDVLGAFFGHDHMNDFVGFVDGIMLGQCKTASFRVYTDGCRPGVRMITLDENNIENVQTKMYHFKDFGLKSKSLDPYMRHVTDRQDMKLKVYGTAIGTIAAVTAAAVAVNKVSKAKKKK